MTQKVRLPCRLLGWMTILGVTVFSAETLKPIKKIPHSGYSEGLDFHEGFLWHALPKHIVKIDPKDGTILEKYVPSTKYSESLMWFQGKLWNLSFHDNGLYAGGLTYGKGFKFEHKMKTPEKHGWGITHNGQEIIMTGDYSNKLYFYDAKSLKLNRTLKTELKDIEDLAWDGRYIWSSSFTTYSGEILALDPKTGKIRGVYKLLEAEMCPVIDGIAVDRKSLWITGKDCPSIYHVEIPVVGETTKQKKTPQK